MVPLVGIMFGNVINGITNYLAYKYEMTQALSSWLVGHFSMVLRGRYEIVYLVVPLVILAFIFANHFNIVGMGKDFSKNLGVPYNFVLFMGLSIAAMITASVVVVVGSISYIGLIVPNLVAMFKGDKIRGTIVDTALFGAIFVLVCDIIGRVVIAPYELPIELIIGILGSIVFIGLLLYRLKNGRKAIINNTIVTPCLLGMNSLYTLIHTAVYFFAGVTSVFVYNANASFAMDLVLMGITATVIYNYLFKKTKYNVLYVLLIGTVLTSIPGDI